jgi:hypothetical protein
MKSGKLKILLFGLLLISSISFGQHVINTNTFYTNVEEVSLVYADEVSNNDLIINIIYTPTALLLANEKLAFVRYMGNHTYFIYLSPDIQEKQIPRVLAHEFIHIGQFESGRLRILSEKDNLVMYNEKVYDLNVHSYYNLPYEKEARVKSSHLLTKYRNYQKEKSVTI